MISPSQAKLAHIRDLVGQSVDAADAARVGFYRPEEFATRLQDWAAADPDGAADAGRPRKQRINLGAARMTEAERSARESSMLREITAAMKRKTSG